MNAETLNLIKYQITENVFLTFNVKNTILSLKSENQQTMIIDHFAVLRTMYMYIAEMRLILFGWIRPTDDQQEENQNESLFVRPLRGIRYITLKIPYQTSLNSVEQQVTMWIRRKKPGFEGKKIIV